MKAALVVLALAAGVSGSEQARHVKARRVEARPAACAVSGEGALPHLRYESDALDEFLGFGGYVVRYDPARRQPSFTVHRLLPDAVQLGGRPAAFRRSSFRVLTLPDGSDSASDRDYARSGYDRGHLVPAGDFAWDQGAKDETFTYANVAPFNPNLNRGAWAQLEAAIRERVVSGGGAAYVVTGSLFAWRGARIGPGALEVPTHYYKLAYFPTTSEALAFVFDNSITTYTGDLSDFQTTVDFVESATGEDFYDLLDDTCEASIESARPSVAALPPSR